MGHFHVLISWILPWGMYPRMTGQRWRTRAEGLFEELGGRVETIDVGLRYGPAC